MKFIEQKKQLKFYMSISWLSFNVEPCLKLNDKYICSSHKVILG